MFFVTNKIISKHLNHLTIKKNLILKKLWQPKTPHQ